MARVVDKMGRTGSSRKAFHSFHFGEQTMNTRRERRRVRVASRVASSPAFAPIKWKQWRALRGDLVRLVNLQQGITSYASVRGIHTQFNCKLFLIDGAHDMFIATY